MLRPVGSPIKPGHIADQKDDGVAQILKVFHLAQKHGVAQVQIGRGGIEARLHAQRTAGLGGFREARLQVLFADDLREALLQVGELFGDGSKGHFTIVNMKALVLMTLLISAAAAQSLTDRFFDEYYFPFNPSSATSAGVHKYDGQLEDYSKAGVAARVAKLKQFEAEFAKLPAEPDRDLVLSNIRASLLEYETIRNWERNPDIYSSGISSSAFTIMSRTFAPPDARLRSLIARERKMPQVLAAARANLKNPPKIYTEIAIEQAPGIIGFFQKDVPLAFKSVTDQKLLAEFRTANDAVIKALEDYQTYLKTDVLPRSNGDFRLGAEKYAKKLLYEEMVDIPLDRLLADWLRRPARQPEEIPRNRGAYRSQQNSAADSGGGREGPSAAGQAAGCFPRGHHAIARFHQRPQARDDSVAGAAHSGRDAAVHARDHVRLDGYAGPLRDGREGGVLQRDASGKGLDAGARRRSSWARSIAAPFLGTAIHEAYPGHYVQFLWMQHIHSRVRKLLGASSNAEGWAHYCEQMMLDEGYSKDPKMRLGQLQDALLRDARYIVGIEMHTGKRTFDQAVDFFVKGRLPAARNGAASRPSAARRTRPIFITRWASCKS